MAGSEDRYKDIDQHIAVNLRTFRETGNVTQEELAQRMADRGFGFSQATIWKIESGQRPVRASELIALADCLEVFPVTTLTYEPDATRHQIRLEQTNRKAHDTYRTLKEAATAYLEAQINVLFAAREAHDAGFPVTELYTSWLNTAPEEAVIEARVEAEYEEGRSEQVNDTVNKILDTLRANGYEPTLRIEDIKYHEGGPLPIWTPPQEPGPCTSGE